MRYQYEMRDGSRGAVEAASAPEAARRVAERLCGKGACVESFAYEGRSWQNLDCCGPRSGGAGRIKGKAWRAVIKSVATAEQLLWGGSHGHTRYEHRQYELHITEGRVDAEDKRWKTTRYPRRPIMDGGELGGDDTRHPARSDVVCGGTADLPHATAEEQVVLIEEARAAWEDVEKHRVAGMSTMWTRRAEEAKHAEWARWAGRNRLASKRRTRRETRRTARHAAV